MCARNFLRSEAFPEIRKSANLVLWTPLSGDPEFRREFSVDGVVIPAYKKPSVLSRILAKALGEAETSHRLSEMPIETFRIVHETIRRGVADNTILELKGIFTLRSKILGNLPLLRRFLRRIWIWESRRTMSALFDAVKPDMVYVTHPHAGADRVVGAAAEARGVPAVAIVHSWDNLTSKPLWPNKFDGLIVWNDILKKQAETIYQFPSEKIFKSGMPQLDLIGKNPRFEDREQFFKANGLDPSRGLITFACGSPDFLPDQPDILRDLARAISENVFSRPMQLVIRLHPGKTVPEIQALASATVKINTPSAAYGALVFKKGWDGSGSDQEFFFNLLKHTDVFLNCFSTTAIEAAAFDRPIVNIAFDGRRKLDYYRSCLKHYDFNHYKDIVNTDGIWIVKSQAELETAIESYLKDPSIKKEGRKRIATEQGVPFDGGAGRRIGDFLAGQLKKSVAK